MANTGPAAGTYRIVAGASAYDRPFCLDVGGGDMSSGANVQLWGRLYAASQYWRINYDSNGSARIVSLASGKCLDVAGGTMTDGTNVRQYNDNGTPAQRWDFVPDGSDGVCDGGHYDTYVIKSHKSNSYALDIANGTLANRTNVQIHAVNGSNAQRWMFVPMPAFTSGGIYELRSMLKTSMCVDVAGGSSANGANVQLWSHNGTNSQKFYVTHEGSDQWSIMSVASGKYVDVAGGASAVGTNVQQYADNDSRSQRWRVTQYGTTTIDGATCAVVTFGSMVAGSGTTRFMDVKNALTSNSANVQLGAWESGTDYSQRFALYPTSPKSTGLVVPVNIGWVREVGDTERLLTQDEATTLYPSWRTSTKWPTDGANGYQWRYCTQTMSASSLTWGGWGAWSQWEPVAVRVEGKDVWAADGLPATIPSGKVALQYELQVRAISYTGDSDSDDRTGGTLEVSEFAAVTLTALDVIDLYIGQTLGFGPEGLRLPYSTQYNGTVNLRVAHVYAGSTDTDLLKATASFEDLDSSGSVLIPVKGLTRWLRDNETVSITYYWSTDQGVINDANGILWEPHTVSYNTGSGLSVTPTMTVGKGRTIEVRVASANVSRAWVRKGGTVTEMYVSNHVGHVLYPFGSNETWELFVAAHSTDGDRWGVALVDGTQFNALVSGLRPCHAFNWDGGSFLLEVRQKEYLETDYTVDNDAQSYKLNKREWDSYRFGDTKTGKFKAVGALSDQFNLESTRDDIDSLLDARHVTYRSPHGLMCDVAILGASMSCSRGVWTVTIDMIRETV